MTKTPTMDWRQPEITIQVVSDLHAEFRGNQIAISRMNFSTPCDILLLPGDIAPCLEAPRLAVELFRAAGAIVMIAGNHEYYGFRGSMAKALNLEQRAVDKLRKSGANIFLLEDKAITLSIRGVDVQIAGATLWTDYALYGHNEEEKARMMAVRGMADFIAIKDLLSCYNDNYVSRTQRLVERHHKSRAFLNSFLASPGDAPKIIMTHHLPSVRSVSPNFAGSHLNPSFASNLDAEIGTGRAVLWAHGHTHTSGCWRDEAGTLVVCNPFGYARDEGYFMSLENPRFYENFSVRLFRRDGAWVAEKNEQVYFDF